MRPAALAASQSAGADPLVNAVQRQFSFGRDGDNVIPFESYAAPQPETRRPRSAARPHVRRARKASEDQGTLDFLPPSPPAPKTLATTCEAMIRCDAQTAARQHRAVAAAIDWSMALIAYGLFLLVFRLAGGQFYLDRTNSLAFAAALGLVGLAYGSTWAIMGTETLGMRVARLRLVTFDGFPPDSKQRWLRFAGSCMSLCTVVGLLWSLGDEETLTWPDHISRTFPTSIDSERAILRRL